MKNLALLGMLLAAGPAFAQPDPRIDLTGEWRVKFEDRPEFASPDHDDRNWERLNLPAGEIKPFLRGPGWLRKRVELTPDAGRSQLALTLGAIQNVYEVYVNGQRVGASGDFHSFAETRIPRPRTFEVPATVVQESHHLQIAVRAKAVLWTHPDWEMADRGPYLITTRAGAPTDVGRNALAQWRGILSPTLVFAVLYSLIALLSLLAFRSEPARRELFWFAMVCFAYVFNESYCLYTLSVDSQPFNKAGAAWLEIVFGTLMYPFFAEFAASSFGYNSRWLRAVLWLGWSILPVIIIFERDHVFGTIWGCACPSVLAALLVLWHWRQISWRRSAIAEHAFHVALLLQAIG